MATTPLIIDLTRRLKEKRTDFTDHELSVLDHFVDELLEKGMDPQHDEVGCELIGRAILIQMQVNKIREAPGRPYSAAAAAQQYEDEQEERA